MGPVAIAPDPARRAGPPGTSSYLLGCQRTTERSDDDVRTTRARAPRKSRAPPPALATFALGTRTRILDRVRRTATAARHIGVVAGLLLLGLLAPAEAHAQRRHTVREGQTLSAIARRHSVTVEAVLAANGLDRGDVLRPGDVLRIPQRGVIYVKPGQTLSRIARAHDVSVRALARANRMDEDDTLRAGQRLVLPGHRRRRGGGGGGGGSGSTWGRPEHPGVATLIRPYPRKKVRVRLVDRRGRARMAARRRLAAMMREGGSGRTRLPPRHLVQTLARVSDHFGGRPILVVSGYRPAGGYTRASSRHVRGRALDIRVRGVPNPVLRDYCRELPMTGCGFYPRSTFVHVDVRRRSAYWVDWSRPGQRPRYRPPDVYPPGEPEPADADALAESDAEAAGHGDGPADDDPEQVAAEPREPSAADSHEDEVGPATAAAEGEPAAAPDG